MSNTDLLNEFAWGEPIIPVHRDKEWEATVKSELGYCSDIMQRVAPSPWIRNAILHWPRLKVTTFPSKLAYIAVLVSAQENACRYCYGIARSQLQLLGYSEKLISSIERRMHEADLDEKERAFIRFCRNLSRSNPRPPKEDMARLVKLDSPSWL